MKYLWTSIHVKDMDESLKFYQEIVGLNFIERFNAGPGMEIAFLGDGETKIELICSEKLKNMNAGNALSLGFEATSLDEMLNLVKKNGIEIKTGPVQPNANLKYFIIIDPNGVKIQFAQQF